MENLKTIIFFILGLVGLAALSLLFTGQVETDFQPLPTATAPATATPTTGPTPIGQADCQGTPGGGAGGFLPDTPFTSTLVPADYPGQRMVISGTVYASDCITPLPNTLVVVWQTDANGQYDRTEPYILRGQMHTDANGRYEFTTIRPGSYEAGETARPAHIHYLLQYQEEGPFGTRLLFSDDPYLVGVEVHPRILTTLHEKRGPDGLRLYGAFDIVLPIAPPAPTPEVVTDEDL